MRTSPLSAMLFQVSPRDPSTLGIVAATLLGISAVASVVPALASARIDPVIALRSDG